MYPIDVFSAEQDAAHCTSMPDGSEPSWVTVTCLGGARGFKWVITRGGLRESGPVPRGPITPTENMYSSQAWRSWIIAVRFVVVTGVSEIDVLVSVCMI